MSLREQFEYKVMKNNVTRDASEKVFRVTCPFVEDPSILTYNINQAIRIPQRIEKSS